MIWLIRMTQLVAFLVLMAGVFYFTRPTGMAFFGREFPLFDYFLVSVCALIGIIFGCVFRRLAHRDDSETIDPLAEIRAVLKSKSFWSALCVAPFVFGAPFLQIQQNPGDATAFMLAFQTGFFCESVFQRMFGSPPGTAVPEPAQEARAD